MRCRYMVSISLYNFEIPLGECCQALLFQGSGVVFDKIQLLLPGSGSLGFHFPGLLFYPLRYPFPPIILQPCLEKKLCLKCQMPFMEAEPQFQIVPCLQMAGSPRSYVSIWPSPQSWSSGLWSIKSLKNIVGLLYIFFQYILGAKNHRHNFL